MALLLLKKRLSRKRYPAVGIYEKKVYGHLDHIYKSLIREGRRLIVTSVECIDCGFMFRKRDRLTKPGKCPVCDSESINTPLFSAYGKPQVDHDWNHRDIDEDNRSLVLMLVVLLANAR